MSRPLEQPTVPRLEQLHIRNYRVLRDLHMTKLAPLVAMVGPNGCGKSTLLDAFAFLSECLSGGLRAAWARRGGLDGLCTRGASGPIGIELRYREAPGERLMTYCLEIDEDEGGPVVVTEWLRLTLSRRGAAGPTFFMAFSRGEGHVMAVEGADVVPEVFDSPDTLALDVLGRFARYPRLSALRRFLAGWRLYDLDPDAMRRPPAPGAQELLSPSGDNLANVILHLQEEHPERLREIIRTIGYQVPHIEGVETLPTTDGRLLLRIEDAPFGAPIPAQCVSDGTLGLLALLTLLYDPTPPPFVGLEEPEAHVHPSLLYELAERCTALADSAQLFVATQSPYLLNGLAPEQVWVLYRNEAGHAVARQTIEMLGIREAMEEGAQLGDLWSTGNFWVGSPHYSVGTLYSPDRLDRYAWLGDEARMVSENREGYEPSPDSTREG